MTRKADIVIGAGFGDEGKGLTTDFLAYHAHYRDTWVVRHNGGAQAGHTVCTPDGKRHVFSHFSSGTYTGAKTFLSRFFAVNPALLFRELEEFDGPFPQIVVDPRCEVTTYFDMLINEIAEDARGSNRHGSVGVGYGETIERNTHAEFRLTVAELSDIDATRNQLERIRDHWVPKRLADLGVAEVDDTRATFIKCNDLLERWLIDAQRFLQHVEIFSEICLTGNRKNIIFEGAQGLLLDSERGHFPHVTRSRTGVINACEIAATIGMTDLNIYYASRCYKTRHGAGPLDNELAEAPYGIVDKTNKPHPYQGGLRFARLDTESLSRTILTDFGDVPTGIKGHLHLVLTCLDQVPEVFEYAEGCKVHRTDQETFIRRVSESVSASHTFISRGETRNTVSFFPI
ncbi:adenylosuccinate synthetase [Thalassospira xiamenensis]|uniref:Adenylosuccinate synthetase n=1 Tax=Thalassospira xiamenensis TaxID=220697 RepID=A0A285TWL6_9PROT|nr:adenylosuccinate synthetase [Thalassospira xiamenensis]SOC26779.1 adenylosuccinate synthase [Thalassospira xiamenensis]